MEVAPPVINSVAFSDQRFECSGFSSDGADSSLVVKAPPYMHVDKIVKMCGGTDKLIDQNRVVI